MMARLLPLVCLALAACTGPLSDAPNATAAAFNDAFRDTPFDSGAVTVLVRDPKPLRMIQSYTLVPCQNGAAVCGGSPLGRTGSLSMQDGQYVVTGAYPGRTFYLGRGGDGFLQENGILVPLAWN